MMSIDPPPGCTHSIIMHTDQPLEKIEGDSPESSSHAHSFEESFRCQSPYSSESGDPEDDCDSEDSDRIPPEKDLSAPRDGNEEENLAKNLMLSKQNHPQTGDSLRFSDLYLSSLPNVIQHERHKPSGFSVRVEQKIAKLKSAHDSKDRNSNHKYGPACVNHETPLESTPEDLSGDSFVLSAAERGKQDSTSQSMNIQDPCVATAESLSPAPGPKSVKEKIRELEALAARA